MEHGSSSFSFATEEGCTGCTVKAPFSRAPKSRKIPFPIKTLAKNRLRRRNVVTHFSFLIGGGAARLPETRPLTEAPMVRPPPGVRHPTAVPQGPPPSTWRARSGRASCESATPLDDLVDGDLARIRGSCTSNPKKPKHLFAFGSVITADLASFVGLPAQPAGGPCVSWYRGILYGRNQADFHTSSTHAPTRDTYKTRHVGSAASVTKLIARSRSHGFPFSLRLDGLRPAGHSPQLHKHTRRLTRTSPGLGRGACLSVCASHRVCLTGLPTWGSCRPPPVRG